MPQFRVLPPALKVHDEATARAALAQLNKKRVIAFDTETTGLSRTRDYAVILSLSDGIDRWAVWPEAFLYFKDLLENPEKTLIGHNVNFDQWMLLNVGIDLDRHTARHHARVVDTMVLDALRDDSSAHDLKFLSRKFLGIEMVPFKQVFGKQMKTRDLASILLDPANESVVLNYASLDAYATYKLFVIEQQILSQMLIEPGGLYTSLWEYYTKTEFLYTKVLWHMERTGIRVDADNLLARGPKIDLELMQIHRWMCKFARSFNVHPDSDAKMGKIFFEHMGRKPMSWTKTGKPQLIKSTLKAWAKEGCELSGQLLRYRALKKEQGTYVTNLLERIHIDGRIHTTFNQTGARCTVKGTPYLTDRGYLPVEQVRVNDLVLSHAGVPRRVVECSMHAPQPIYKVCLSNGLVLRTNGEHPYRIGGAWVPADRLSPGLPVVVHSDAEDWRPVQGWAPYEVSSWGRVRNRGTGKLRAQQPKGKWGHLKVSLAREGAQARGENFRDFSVHRLVLEAFTGPSVQEVRHLNGIAWDNTLRNLAYGTSSENTQDAQSDEALATQYGITREHMRDVRTGKKWLPEDYVEGARASFYVADVVSVTVEAPEVTYGLEVEEDHSHVTAGIVTHNTGRLSSSSPNLTNQPGYIRDCYIPSLGCVLAARDYEQLEIRVLAHLSEDENLIAAIRAGQDVHSATAAKMFGVSYESIMDAKHKNDRGEKLTDADKAFLEYRRRTKTLGFGIIYGMGPRKLAEALGIELDEAKALIEQYFLAVPGVPRYFAKRQADALRDGYCTTVLGRRRQVREIWSYLRSESAQAERRVKNAPIQGGAAGIVMKAMLAIWCDPYITASGTKMMIQVHDELVFDVPAAFEKDEELWRRIDNHMATAVGIPFRVRLATSMKSGCNWAECK